MQTLPYEKFKNRRILHIKVKKCPCQESNLIYDLRKVACSPSHSKDIGIVPRRGVEPRPTVSKTVMHPSQPQGKSDRRGSRTGLAALGTTVLSFTLTDRDTLTNGESLQDELSKSLRKLRFLFIQLLQGHLFLMSLVNTVVPLTDRCALDCGRCSHSPCSVSGAHPCRRSRNFSGWGSGGTATETG